MSISFKPQETLAFIAKSVITAYSISNGLPLSQANQLGSLGESIVKGIEFTKKAEPMELLLHDTINNAILSAFDSDRYEIPDDCKDPLLNVFNVENSYSYLKSDNPFALIVSVIEDICQKSTICDISTLPTETIATDILCNINKAIYENHQLTALYTLFRTQSLSSKLDAMGELSRNINKEHTLICNSHEIAPQKVYGRESELREIEQRLQNSNILFIGGIDGIGKTTLVKHFFFMHKEEYTQILYLPYNKDFIHLFGDDLSVTITNFSKRIMPDDTLETDEAYFYRKIQKLKEIVTKQTAIIIDGYTFNDKNYDDIISLNATFVFISNKDVRTLSPSLVIEKIVDVTSIRRVFFEHYSRSDISENDEKLNELLSFFDYHTLSVILIAKQLRVSRNRPEEVLSKLDRSGIGESLNQKVYMDISSPFKTPYELLIQLFQTNELSQDEIYILNILCLIAPAKPFSPDLSNWIENANLYLILDKLQSCGWIEIEDKTDTITIHPLIKEIILSCKYFKPNEYHKFMHNFASEYSAFDLFALPLEKKYYYAEIAYCLCRHIDEIDDVIFPFCVRAERILSIGYYAKESLEFLDRIQQYLSKKPNSIINVAYLHYCRGWTYATQYRNRTVGLIHLEKAINLLSQIDHWSSNQTECVANIYADYGINLCRSGLQNCLKSFGPIRKAIALLYTLKNKTHRDYLHISWLYAFLAESYINTNKFQLAKKCICKAYGLQKKYSGKEDVFLCNIMLRDSMLKKSMGKYREALQVAHYGYNIYVGYSSGNSLASIEHMVYIGDLYFLTSDTNKARQYYVKAYDLACKKYHNRNKTLHVIRTKIKKTGKLDE